VTVTDSSWAPLRDAIPSFGPAWRNYRDSYLYHSEEPYNSIAELAKHLVRCAASGETSELPAFFGAFESLYSLAEDPLQDLLRIGVLEGIQLEAANQAVALWHFTPWLGPASRDAWESATEWLDGPPDEPWKSKSPNEEL
jgi:hypothetical protein